MKIYLLINQSNAKQRITASESLAKQFAENKLTEGAKVHLYEGELKTQGKKFCSWANNWKELEIKMPF